jgi:hypothetical protein
MRPTKMTMRYCLFGVVMLTKARLKTAVAVVVPLILLGCATMPNQAVRAPKVDLTPNSQIVIAAKFQVSPLHASTAHENISNCFPNRTNNPNFYQYSPERFPANRITILEASGSGNRFYAVAGQSFCVRSSASEYPILAAEAFYDTVEPDGVPIDVKDNWFSQIALQIALKGSVTVDYVFANGNAFRARYWAPLSVGGQTINRQDSSIQYSVAFMKAGTWEANPSALRFSHVAMSSVKHVQNNNRFIKFNLISHRFKNNQTAPNASPVPVTSPNSGRPREVS